MMLSSQVIPPQWSRPFPSAGLLEGVGQFGAARSGPPSARSRHQDQAARERCCALPARGLCPARRNYAMIIGSQTTPAGPCWLPQRGRRGNGVSGGVPRGNVELPDRLREPAGRGARRRRGFDASVRRRPASVLHRYRDGVPRCAAQSAVARSTADHRSGPQGGN